MARLTALLTAAALAAAVTLLPARGGPKQAFSITDTNALIRTGPPQLKATGQRIPYGTLVRVLEEKTVKGQTYVRVQRQGGKEALGWTARSNLGSAKEFDPAMRPEDAVAVDRLSGLDLTMASIYNARGKYLKEQATALGTRPSTLAAVLQVESGGRAFGNDGRAIIRFENHVFFGQWGKANKAKFDRHFQFDKKQRWKGHQWRKSATGAWKAGHQSQAGEWEVLEFAKGLNEAAALKSASYGAAQIMGFNHKAVGYGKVQDMVRKFDAGIRPQLDAMIAFIRANKACMKGLKNNDYVTFATGYNGKGQAAAYGGRIKAAAASYAKVTKGKKHAD